jgi:hypothetical protein
MSKFLRQIDQVAMGPISAEWDTATVPVIELSDVRVLPHGVAGGRTTTFHVLQRLQGRLSEHRWEFRTRCCIVAAVAAGVVVVVVVVVGVAMFAAAAALGKVA